jgi:hypothetical protein
MDQLRRAREMFLLLQRKARKLVDTLERAKNLLNWSDPAKTGLVLAGLLFAFVGLCAVPTRLLVLGKALVGER